MTLPVNLYVYNGYVMRVVFYINVSIVQLGYEQSSFQRVPKLIQNLSNVLIKQVPMQQLSYIMYITHTCDWLDISRDKTCLCLGHRVQVQARQTER